MFEWKKPWLKLVYTLCSSCPKNTLFMEHGARVLVWQPYLLFVKFVCHTHVQSQLYQLELDSEFIGFAYF